LKTRDTIFKADSVNPVFSDVTPRHSPFGFDIVLVRKSAEKVQNESLDVKKRVDVAENDVIEFPQNGARGEVWVSTVGRVYSPRRA
jgi:hypothetical protein